MAVDRTVKSISFNELDPFEVRLLAHARQFRGFSAYIKRLIQRDMEGGEVAAIQITTLSMPERELPTNDEPKVKLLGFV